MKYVCPVCHGVSAHPGKCVCGMANKQLDYNSIVQQRSINNIPDKFDIAVYSENNGFYSGGRYYIWQLAHALAEIGLNVCFYTNMKPVFDKDYSDYKPFTIIKGEFRNYDPRSEIKANCYIGNPVFGNIISSRVSGDKPCYVTIFDPLNQIKEHHPEDYAMEMQYHSPMFDSINDKKNKIICLTEYGKKGIQEWLDRKPDDIEVIYPVVNSKVADKIKILSISRVVGRKNYQDTIEVLSRLPENYELEVITSTGISDLNTMVKTMNLENRIKIHFQINDKQKFDIFRSSDIVLNTTLFEGFGMWMTEAIFYDKPIVCYDFPTFREIEKNSKSSKIFFAKRKDIDDLTKKILSIDVKRADEWSFESMKKQVSNIFLKYKTRKIGWVADFFENKKGGAQKTNDIMIKEGEKRGFEIDKIKTSEVLTTNLSNYELLIVNNIAQSTEAIKAKIMKHKYIRYEHDYLSNYFDDTFISDFFSNSLASIFLSPLHKQQHEKYLSNTPTFIVNSPIETELFSKGKKNRKYMWAGEMVSHKGIDNVLDYAKQNPDKQIDFYGWRGKNGNYYEKEIRKISNCNYLGSLEYKDIPSKMASYYGFIHMPDWKEPFGRAVMEAYLSGCELVTNENVGAMSFDWDYKNYKEVKEQLKTAPIKFWDIINNYANNRSTD